MSTLSSQIASLSPEQLAKLAYELKASKARKTKAPEIPRRSPEDPCPLSFAQQRLWFIAQLEPDDPSYNCIEALRMTGKLNVRLLEQTFNEVIRRHEALRTTFRLIAGEPVQIVSPETKLTPSFIDLRALPASERERQVSELSSKERQRPFDLAHGPLLRVVILQISEHEHAVVFTTHHIVSDGWSRDVLVREIIDLYLAFSEGRQSPLAELPLQYGDFAVWQRQTLSGPVLEKHLDYWRQNLTGAPQVLALPTDHQRPAVLTRHGFYEAITLSPELSHALRALGNREGVTLFMTMLAAFDVLLSRYSGQTDFLIGTDIANRNQDTTQPLIGFFVNQLVLRVDLAGDPTFNELLQRVKEVTLNGYAHQEVPFEKVVDMLNPERNLSHAPLFQVKLVLQNAGTGTLDLPEVSLSAVEFDTDIARFDLTLIITESQDRINAEIEYSTDLFESSTIKRMLTHFEKLLASAVRDPQQHLSQLELLGSAERHQLLVERNDTAIPYPRTRCIQELFEEQVALFPDKPALTFHDQHLSYGELNTRANQLAHYLRQAGVNAEIPVGVCLNRSIEMIVAVFAILKAGGVYIPLDPQYPAERLTCILDEVQPSIILTDSTLIDELPSTGARGICLDTDEEWWSQLPDTNLPVTDLTSENLAHVLYTSGSTGKPKGVAIPHRGVVRLVSQETYVTYGPDEVFLQMGSLSFDASTLEIFSALLTGGRLVLLPPGAPSLDDLATVLTSEGVSKLWVTAGLFHPMVEHRVDALAEVRDVMSGGDVLSVEHVRRLLRVKAGYGSVINGYGPTESTVFTCCHRVGSEDELEHGVPIGKPIGNTRVYVLGSKMELLAGGMVGELYVGGDGLARCYYNQPELTAERFVPNPFSTTGGERLYRTGDYVRWRADGLMEFVGRVDTQVKIRGYRIEPGEIEAVLGQHASVSDCAVVARQEEDGEKYLVAYVVTKANGHSESTFELKEYLRERLPDFMVPSAIVAIESLPLTQNGKVDRRELSAREVLIGGDRPYVPPSTETEELLCDIWQEVLGAERVGIDDNFFDLGGDSILTIQVIVKARAVGLNLNVQQLFQYQTVQELAHELESSVESSDTAGETEPFSLISEEDRAALPAGVVDAYPLTALQAGMLFHSELSPDAGHYHDIFSAHLRMPFDEDAFRATLQQLIDSHPVLRTSFNLSDFSEPLQLVHQDVVVPLQIGDRSSLSSMSLAEQKEFLAEWMAEEKKHRFDWSHAPLMRFQIDRRDDESVQFSFSFHHAILDGWSMATMLTDLFRLYSERQTDDRAGEVLLSASFRDYVAAERAVLGSEEAREYWTRLLSDATQSRLPRLGQSAGPSRVVGHKVPISPELSYELKELARTAGVPLKTVLLAAHLRVLSVITGDDDVVTGIVSHGRPETESGERVLGLFLNTLPFRFRLAGGTWLQLIQEIFEAEREQLPFRRYPMARMQQDLGNGMPLFEVIFNFVHFHIFEELQNVGGLEVLDVSGNTATNFTLSVDFSLDTAGSKIKLEVNYDAADLNKEQIEAVGRNYLTVLESMVHTPFERYEHESLLSPEERRKILYEWNETTVEYEIDVTLSQLFERRAERAATVVAVVSGETEVTYGELNQRANRVARYLRTLGVGPDSRVGVLADRGLEMVVALLGILKAGAAYVPMDPAYPRARLEYMMADAAVSVLLTERRQQSLAAEIAANVETVLYLDDAWAETESAANLDEPIVDPDNLAYVIYTSGSTGQPKGVMNTHRGICNRIFWMQDAYHLTPGDRVLQKTPFSFDVSVWEFFWPLLTGARLVMAEPGGHQNPAYLRHIIEQEQITVMHFVPAMLQIFLEEPELERLTSLRKVFCSGEALGFELQQQFFARLGAKLYNLYGPTEAAVDVTHWTCNPNSAYKVVPIGMPIVNTQIYLLDQNYEPVLIGVPAELHIGGVNLARGYHANPSLTAEKFVPNPFSNEPGTRLYKTGDLARHLPDGSIEYLGRIDQQVKLRGFRIELGEIEAVLKQHDSVREAVVVTHEIARGEQRLVAYVQLRAGEKLSTRELRSYLFERLPEYMVPASFMQVDEFALTPSGKINRRALPAPESIAAPAAEYEAPRTETEELLSGLWARVLRVSRVGINDNFFELGGHSLLAIQLFSRIRDTFGVELPLTELFDRRTLADLAQSIDEQMRAGHALVAPPLLPALREDVLPLSFAQQRLWFLDQLEPESIAYNMAEALRLRGELNVAALEQSINEVMRRHEAVRTVFPDVDGNPIQVITPFKHLALPFVDLSSMSDDDREVQALRLASAEARRPFDLQSGPLLRTALLRLGAEDHVLLFSMHHIIGDGWSNGILVNEVTALYDAFTRGTESPFADLAIQYGDFAVWQRQWLSDEVLARQLDYWTNKLQDVPPLLALPTDYPRPKVQQSEGAFSSRLLSAELTSDLKALTQQSGATLYMTTLAAFHVLLHRYAQQAGIVTGTPMANRTRVETEPLIGFFVNTLVLRSDFDDDPTFLTHLGRLRKHALEAYALQDLPFDLLVDELQIARDLSYNPLFQVMFSWEEAALDEMSLTGLELGAVGVENRTAPFDLTLRMGEVDGRLRCSMQYNTALFEVGTIERMLGHFEQLLLSVMREPQQRVSQLSLVTGEEQQQLLVELNETTSEYRSDSTIQKLFESQVVARPEALAVSDAKEQLSYGELNRRANQLAHYVRRHGVDRESLVAVCLEPGVEQVVTLLGILKAGAAYVPLDPDYPQERLRFMFADADVKAVITNPQLAESLGEGEQQVLSLDRISEELRAESDENPAHTTGPDDRAYVIYTSGSTGRPKGVEVEHRGVLNLSGWHQDYYEVTAEDRATQVANPVFDASVWELWPYLTTGASVHVMDEETRVSPRKLLAWLSEQRITLTFLPTPLAEAVLSEPMPDELSLRALLTGGDLLHRGDWQSLPFKLVNHYGPTESTVVATCAEVNAEEQRAPSIGRPIANTKVYLCDETLQLAPMGVAGQLMLASDSLARGYLGRPDLTAERFLPNPFSSEGGARLYLTGDVARYRADGQLEFLGRADSQVKLRGYRIELGEVEAALRSHDDVQDAVVVVSESEGDKRLVGYVVSADANSEQLREWLRQRLPEYMVPSVIVSLAELPLTPNGKVDRKALPAVRAEAREYVGPRNAVEEVLSGIWVVVLKQEQVSVHDNFFELGGHSLLATQLISRVRESFAVELPLRELFAHPTVAGLAEQVETALRDGVKVTAPPLVRVSREQQLPLSHAQERLWFLDQLEPGSVAYNIPRAIRLTGRLDVEALARTLNEVVRRHEVLRTRFVAVNGEAVQVISSTAYVEMPVIDLSELPAEQQEAKARELAAAEAQQPFDLSEGPLLRVQLLQFGAEDHVVLFTLHHIVSDGWSTGILVREVGALYEAYIEGHESPLPELEVQYADYAVWQREWLQGEVLEQQLSYWRQQLGAELPVLQLPTDRPRPPVQSYRGQVVNFSLPAELTAELKKLSNAEGVTLYMTMLAVFKLVLWRYSGQREVVIGTPIAGRNHLATEGLIGLFVNTLVLRTSLSGNPRFSELLERVKEVTLGAYAHQDLPFEKLVEELQPERDLSRSPLFQVMFILQNASVETFRLPGLEASGVGSEDETAKFDLTMGLAEVGGELHGSLQYSVDLFDAATIERLVEHYELLLRAVVTEPERQLSELPLLIEADRQKLAEWNETEVAYELEQCMHELFEAQVKRTPDAVALVAGESRLSYAELEARAERLARRLRRGGVGPEQRVGIVVGRNAAMVVAVLGVLKAGGAYVPLDASYPLERLSLMAADAQLSVLVAEEGMAVEFAGPDLKLVLVDATGECVDDGPDEREELSLPPVTAENLAYVIYTSGSTGRPKGVAITHRSAVAFMHWAQEVFSPEALAGVLASTSLSFDLSVFEMFVTLSVGGKVILADNALHLPTLAAAEEVTLINTVPSAMAELLRLGAIPSSVQAINLAGEALPESLVQEIYQQTSVLEVWNLYGPSEDTTYSTATLIEKNQAGPMVIGRPIANTQAYLCDETLERVPVGVAGQLLLAGDGLARGYLGRPDLTAERFLPNPFSSESGDRLYLTGDLARYRADGQLEFLGRADSQVKLRGFRIELGEVEAALRSHEDVQDAVVVVSESEGDKRLVGYVVSTVSSEQLRGWLRQRLPEYMVPSVLVPLSELPLTPNGKVDRKALPAAGAVRPEEEYVGPRNAVEEVLSGIWAGVLKQDQVSVHDNFFELGGHSLLATQVISRVRTSFAVELPLRALFQQPTVAGLALSIEAAQLGDQQLAPPIVRVSRQEPLPLSFAQQRLWFIDQLEPGSTAYNIPMAVRLSGRLNLEVVERTFAEVVRRHEALRTRFVMQGGQPVQVVQEPDAFAISVTDLSDVPEGEREERVRALAMAEAQQPFDLQSGPLLRVSLLRLADEEHVALFTMHHIVSDGWSMGILVREVAALYSAYVRDEASPLPELAVQYGDFAAWQREWLKGEVLDRQLSYWKERLEGASPALELPTDRPRPTVLTQRGAQHGFGLSAELSRGLQQLSRREGATLFMVLLSAFAVLLKRYTGQEDILVGSPIAGRNRDEVEGLIGFFVNTLVMRTDVSGDPSFRELLERVKEVALGAYAHQDLPFEKLVEELQPERSLGHTPLFQVMLVVQNAPGGDVELPDLTLTPVDDGGGETAKFEMTLTMLETRDGLRGSVNYNRDLFDGTTIERMMQHWTRLLEAVAADATQRLSELPMLSGAEQQQLLVEWNDTASEYARELTVAQMFEQQVERDATAVALVYGTQRISYGELNKRANQLAHYLRAHGVGPETLVGLYLERSVELVVAMLAVVKTGGAYVPLDPQQPSERVGYMLADANVSVLLTKATMRDTLPEHSARVVSLDADWEEISREEETNLTEPEAAVGPDNLAYVIYTSGSTGQPKGVMVTHGALVNYTSDMCERLPVRSGWSFATLSGPAVDLGYTALYPALCGGGVLHVIERELINDAEALGDYFSNHPIDCLKVVPTQLAALQATAGGRRVMARKRLVLGGESSANEWLTELRRQWPECRVMNHYGPTEATVGALTWEVREQTSERSVPIGKPITNVRAYVLDPEGRLAPVGVIGELYLGGAGLARGYVNQPAQTAARFVPDEYSGEMGERLYRTGDLVRRLKGGEIEFVGRVDGQVKVRGHRVELGEVEAVLRRYTAVGEAAVSVRVGPTGDTRLVAFIVGSDFNIAELRNDLKRTLPEYMIPTAFVQLSELPRLRSGKVDYQQLSKVEETRAIGKLDHDAPATPVAEMLCEIWQEVLRIERVGARDNFFELGGHSLLATQLISRVRESFAVELPLRELFAHPTVAGLAEQVETALRDGVKVTAPPLVRVSREQQLPLSHAQERLWFLDQLEPGSVAYNIPRAVRLTGRLDVEALERTLNEVVRRHEVLRTRFVAVNGEAVQVISSTAYVEMPVIDLSELPAEEQEAKARELAAAEAQQPFDLSEGPLLRVQLLQFGAEDHVVLFTLHHIVSDGWSTGILVREVGALYEAYIEGHESPLPELEVQYADYAVWQREWLQGEVLEQQLTYWRQQLGEELPVLQLPTDRARPPVQSYRGQVVNFSLPAELTAELKQLSNAEGVTLYMTMLAVFKLVLWRYSGQREVVIGTPIAGRNHLATEGLIGLFVNTLVLRTSLSGNPRFSELLERVKEVTLGAYAHQDLPFEKLVEELQPERDLSRSPLFQVMFILQNASVETFRLPGLEASGVGSEDETAKFDLTMGLAEVGGEVHGSLQYSVDLFEAATIERLVEHYELLLRAVVTDPERQLSELPLLIEADRQKLKEWNETEVAYELEQCMHELFAAQVKRTPDAVALVAGDARLSYAELEARAERLARRLRRGGVGPEQRVGIAVGRNAAMVVAVLGVLKAGGAYVPLDASYPLERLSLMAADAQLSVLVAEEGIEIEFAGPDLKLVLVNATGECVDNGPDEEIAAPQVTAENLAYVIYTSGSTGRPKGVAITHRSAVAFMHWAQEVFSPAALSGVLASTSLSFDLSVFEMFVTLSVGGKVILADNALHLPTLAAAEEVTLINTVPSAMAELLRLGAIPDSVQAINLAGEALPESLVQEIYQQTGVQQVWNLYGPSEDTTYSTAALIAKNQAGPMVIGRPIANTQAYLCDETLELVPVGVAGQLLLAGDGLARGYLGRPDLTAERFLPNPFSSESGDRLYLTGDLARYRKDGQLEFLGRADSQVKLRGFRIELGEIETVLRQHAAVREAVVIAATHADDKRLLAYVVMEQSDVGVSDLRDHLHRRLPDYMAPSAFVLMEALPLTANGKINRRALPPPDESTTTQDSALTTPRDALELQLSQIWKEVLRRDHIGLRDNFFDLGGHSLLAVRLLHNVERSFGQKIPVSTFFQGATIEQLAATLRERGGEVREHSLVSIQPRGSRPPLFLVHSASGNVMSYIALSRQLGREQPVYGLQSRGLDPDRKPTTRVEDMASEYLQELITMQPEGPYHLGGWSMGGVIAFEMARQLTAEGKSLAPLVLIDSTIHLRRVKKNGLDDASVLLALAQHHGLFLDETDKTFEDLRSLTLDEQLEYFFEKAANSNLIPYDIGLAQLRHLFELFKVNYHAAENYRPRKSAQQVILFQAAGTPPAEAAKKLKQWKKIAEVVTAQRLPGDHYSILSEPNVSVLAEKLTPYLPN